MPPDVPVPPPAEFDWPTALVAISLTLGPAIIALLRDWLRQRRIVAGAVEGIARARPDKQTRDQLALAWGEDAAYVNKLASKRHGAPIIDLDGDGIPDAPKPDAPPLALLLLLVAAGVAILTLPGCSPYSLSSEDVRMIRFHRDANAELMEREELPRAARDVAQRAHDAFAALDYSATGAELPPEVRARLGVESPAADEADAEEAHDAHR